MRMFVRVIERRRGLVGIFEKKINNTLIRLWQGDITELEVDAIVNAANNHFWMGSGVAGAIKKKGGQEIEEEAMKKGPVPVGEAVVTGAGNLRAAYVIHAAVMGQDLQTDGGKIIKATENSLRRAQELGIKTIAFPALGTGVGGFPLEIAGELMLKTVIDFIKNNPTNLEEIVFALFNEEAFAAFSKALEKLET
jgi:O-acetyl-ADP-ribose deacetylase (regulator of RNase III)